MENKGFNKIKKNNEPQKGKVYKKYEEYLKNKLEPEKEIIFDLPQNVNKEIEGDKRKILKKIKRKVENVLSGKEEFSLEEGDFRFSFTLSSIPKSLEKKLFAKFNNLPEDKIYLLDDFILENNNAKISIKEIISQPVYYIKGNKSSYAALYGNDYCCIFLITEKINSINGILTLFHEIGHIKIYESLSNEEKEELKLTYRTGGRTQFFDSRTDFCILKNERNAWAYALKKIKPFLKDLKITKDDLRVIIHNHALGSYSRSISHRMRVKEERKKIFKKVIFLSLLERFISEDPSFLASVLTNWMKKKGFYPGEIITEKDVSELTIDDSYLFVNDIPHLLFVKDIPFRLDEDFENFIIESLEKKH